MIASETEETTKTKKDRRFVTALARGLAVLRAFRSGDESLSNAEICRRTGLAKATVTRLTYTLIQEGYLSIHQDTGRYLLLPHVLALGYPVMASLDIRQVAKPLMQRLADLSGGQVAMGLRDGVTMILVERSRDRTVVTLPLDIGSCLPIEKTSIGRAYLAALSEEERENILQEVFTVNKASATERKRINAQISREMQRYEKNGYCFTLGEWDPDVNSVAAPLRLPNGSLIAFNCGGPSSRIRKDQLDSLGKKLLQLLETVSIAQGANPNDVKGWVKAS